MPATRKRENRENQFYNVGEQGRKTGIRLEDKGMRDEYGMEPVSGIFSSPEKSPPKRNASVRKTGGTVTDSESMDIQESSIPDLTPGHILRNKRTNLPPPRSRSPMKTALGSSPRRQSSMVPHPRHEDHSSSPNRALSHPAVSRRLDFDQEETSLQETPALSGSGARRGGKARRDIYEIEPSPVPTHTAMVDESLVQEEITANEDSNAFNGIGGDSFVGLEEDATGGANGVDDSVDIEESEVIQGGAQKSTKRGRKRKSDVINAEEEPPAPAPKKGRTATKKASAAAKGKKSAQPSTSNAAGRPARRKRVSEVVEDGDAAPTDESFQEDAQPIKKPSKGRGRPPKASIDTSIDDSVQVEESAGRGRGRGRPPKEPALKAAPGKENTESPTFKKPASKSNAKSKVSPLASVDQARSGRLVDAAGKPLSKDQIDQMSTTSTGSRFGRGRQLSVFREFGAEQFGRVGRTGRHHLPPVNFWAGEQVNYDKDGSLVAVYQPEAWDEAPKKRSGPGRKRGGKRAREEQDDDELEEWETKEGVVGGVYRDYDAGTETVSNDLLEGPIAWSEKGIKPNQVPSQQFKFCKLATAGDTGFFSWGAIELEKDGIKRAKNSRKMHMVFNVTKGAVEVNVNDNVFTIHNGGVWQVPRGNLYSIRNVARGESRIFFAQAFETVAQIEVAED